MIDNCISGWGLESGKLLIASLSFIVSISLLLALKKFSFSTKSKIVIIYSHLTTLLFPLILLTTNVGCAAVCASCYTNVYHLFGLVIPTTFFISTAIGFMVIPAAFVYSNRNSALSEGNVYNFVKKSSSSMKIKQPKVYILNKSSPVAFSFRNFKSAIFLSVGMFEIMKWKEVQAVILHELAHIKQKSSALKLSTFFMRIFSPLSIILKFHHNNKEEEKKADRLASKIQGTDRYLKSARNKILEYQKSLS